MAPWDGYRAPPPARLSLAALPWNALPPPPPPPPPHVCAPYCNPHTCWDPQCTACTDLGCVGPPPPPYWYWPSLPPDPAPPASPTPSPPPVASQAEPSPPSSPIPSAPAPPLPPLNTTEEHTSLPVDSPVVLASYDSYDTAGEVEDGTLASDWQGQTRSCAQLEERCDVSRCCADSEQSCFVVSRRATPPSVEARCRRSCTSGVCQVLTSPHRSTTGSATSRKYLFGGIFAAIFLWFCSSACRARRLAKFESPHIKQSPCPGNELPIEPQCSRELEHVVRKARYWGREQEGEPIVQRA